MTESHVTLDQLRNGMKVAPHGGSLLRSQTLPPSPDTAELRRLSSSISANRICSQHKHTFSTNNIVKTASTDGINKTALTDSID